MNGRNAASGLSCIASLCLVAGAQAQTAIGNVVANGGGSTLQIDTGNGVNRVCGALGQAGFTGVQFENRAPTSAQEDLYFRCNEMVHTANGLANAAGTGNSLGLSAAELGRAMQQLAGEENGSKGRLATETSNGQFANIGLRLDALARGARAVTAGLATTGLPLDAVGGNAGADPEGGGWGWFATGAVGTGERSATLAEDEYEYDSNGITFGADYQFDSGFVLGTAAGIADFDVDFTDLSQGTLASTAAGGSIGVDGYSLSMFGLAQPGRLTIDGIVVYGNNDYKTVRNVTYAAAPGATGRGNGLVVDRGMLGSTDSDQWAAGLSLGTSFNWGATSLYLDGGFTYLDIDVDGYTEDDPAANGGLNLIFDEQGIKSRQARLAVHLTRAFSGRSAVVNPFIQLEWRHEYENDAVTQTARYANAPAVGSQFDLVYRTDAPDEDFMEADVGLVLVLRNNLQLVLDYRTSLNLDLVDADLVSFSFRGGF
jgi:outer membrane lipase/esterase